MINNIPKTGFLLEYNVAEKFKNKNWDVITNKYYIDDISGIPREIDLLVTKTESYRGIDIKTSILISCKKSESDDFLFLTKLKDSGTTNITYYPKQYVGNERLKYINAKEDLDFHVFTEINILNEYRELFATSSEVFAFQQMSKSNQSPQNQKAIYSSVTSLVKALEYELGKSKSQGNKKVIHNFYLLSVCETTLFSGLVSTGNSVVVKKINYILYVNQYIVNGKEASYPMSFTTFDNLDSCIDKFDVLHTESSKSYKSLIELFFVKILTSFQDRREYMTRHKLSYEKLFYKFISEDDYEVLQTYGDISMNYSLEENKITFVSLIFNKKVVDALKGNDRFIVILKNWFDVNFHFDGEFDFVKGHYDDYDDYDENEIFESGDWEIPFR